MKYFLLIDDHEVVRSGIRNILLQLYKPCVIHEAGDKKAVFQQLNIEVYDLLIMDVQIPGTDTVALMEYLTSNYPAIKVLIFSMSNENIYAPKFLNAGAMGFVSKTADIKELKIAINLVLNNRRYLSENLAQLLAGQIKQDVVVNPFATLSKRETETAFLMIHGNSVNAIAALLKISISTVATYKSGVFRKLAVKNIVQLIEFGRLYKFTLP